MLPPLLAGGRDMTWLKVVHTRWAAEAVEGLTQVVGGGDGAGPGLALDGAAAGAV